jgi:hypothetical protein
MFKISAKKKEGSGKGLSPSRVMRDINKDAKSRYCIYRETKKPTLFKKRVF